MNAGDFDFLTSPQGAAVLTDLAETEITDAATLAILTRLRRTLPASHAAAAVEQVKLRQRASAKFGQEADRLLFTRDGLEQASDPHIRRYRAAAARGIGQIIDACCGIGTDALAFAAEGAPVLGLDTDALRIEIARHNAAVLGLSGARFALHDVTRALPEAADLVFFDPARRDETGRRLHHVERYRPPLSTLSGWDAPHVWVKLSPAVEHAEIAAYGGSVAFHSVAGDLKEALLMLNARQADVPQASIAVRHDADGTHVWTPRDPAPETPVRPPSGWLLEPDPALMRAGAVRHFAAHIGAAQIDPTIAYLVHDAPPVTPWARAWPILTWMPFNLKRLRATLRERALGRITVKKRGHAMTPEQLIAALRPDGEGGEAIVVLTRVDGAPAVIICQPA